MRGTLPGPLLGPPFSGQRSPITDHSDHSALHVADDALAARPIGLIYHISYCLLVLILRISASQIIVKPLQHFR